MDLTPHQIVVELDKYIIGQEKAKKSVAIALRNRFRRNKLHHEIKDDIVPKNILMIGPTGVGKTEIARRLAKLVNAPFVKVEATKFTEVGYVGRDVESMIRELVETSIRMVKQEKVAQVEAQAAVLADELLLEIFVPKPHSAALAKNPFDVLFGNNTANEQDREENLAKEEKTKTERKIIKKRLLNGELDEEYVEIEVEEGTNSPLEMVGGSSFEEMGLNLQDLFGSMFPKKKRRKKVMVKQARQILTQQEAQKLIDAEQAVSEGVRRAEDQGIIFLDEIDKIAAKESYGPDVSRGGVQRDILPIVEGSTILTKYGPVKTDYILFIAAGAFHTSKPSDLIPELQGRFPIRVELDSLKREDFKRILVEPRNSLLTQYTELLKTEGFSLEFTENAIDEIADIAYTVNDQTENIGARRLHTIMEKLLEDILFAAPDLDDKQLVIDSGYVRARLETIVANEDLSRYIL